MRTPRPNDQAYICLGLKVFVFLICFYVLMLASLEAHEAAHVQIYEGDGCRNTSVSIDYLRLSGATRCTDPGYTTSALARASHNLNEIVSYNLDALIAAVLIGFFLLSINLSTSSIS